jgi:uncharacterized protein RhaS with RHS repeats
VGALQLERDYNPALGMYIQSDPIELDAGVDTYAYVYGSLLDICDFMGLAGVVACVTLQARERISQYKHYKEDRTIRASSFVKIRTVRK